MPNEEHYQALLGLQEGLLSGKITEENIAGGAKAEPRRSHLEPTGPDKITPPTPTPPKVSLKKGAKKGNDLPSRDKADSTPDIKDAHCNGILIFNGHTNLDDEATVKKANPALRRHRRETWSVQAGSFILANRH